jgi:threonyl-tRNA synthetase
MSAIRITLPDNSVRELEAPVSIGAFAGLIGPGLAKSAVGGIIDGELVDIRTMLDHDLRLEIVTLQNPRSVEIIRHSAAHIMAQAVQSLWPDIKVTIGPVIETGFFYDLDSPRAFAVDDLEKIEKEMSKIVAADHEIKREVWPIERAIETFKKTGENFKVEIIEDLKIKQNATEVTIYHQGPWFDLCRGPHVPRTSFLKAFKLTSIAGAYWRGDEKNKMLQRIYGTAFASKKDLESYLIQVEESKKRDHRKLGKELDLFMFHAWAPASPFFLPKGTVLYNELIKYLRELYLSEGYDEVVTPQIFDSELFKCSGHYDNYLDNMYSAIPSDKKAAEESGIADTKFSMVKAMNCPSHALIFGAQLRSYRQLPMRLADFGRLHRFERAGVTHGLARVRTFSQDDAHIFCTLDQVQGEITRFMKLLNKIYATFGFEKYEVNFSTRPEKRIGSDELWDKAETSLSQALTDLKLNFKVNAGDGAFYGPKLDIMVTDAIGRAWQLGTLQFDPNMGERFKLEYVGDDNKPHKPIVLHRAILGSLERFLAVYIEHCAGAFPTWIAPVQVVIINISANQETYAREIEAKLMSEGVRVQTDLRFEKLGFKVREAQLQKIPYMLILGDNEMNTRTVSVRLKVGKEIKGVSVDSFIESLKQEIKARALISPFLNENVQPAPGGVPSQKS